MGKWSDTYINTAGEEAAEEEAAVEDAIGNVAQLHVLHAARAQVADSAMHADGAKGDEPDNNDLRPWRVVCGMRLAFPDRSGGGLRWRSGITSGRLRLTVEVSNLDLC